MSMFLSKLGLATENMTAEMCAHTAEEEAANEETHITFLLYTHHKNDGANKHLATIVASK